MTTGELARLAGGQLRDVSDKIFVTGVSVDTRNLQPGDLFIPLVAARDGHDFIGMALEKGAAAVMTSRLEGAGIFVENTDKALLDLAASYRSKYSPMIVGVTGSVGKTTTKEMIAAVLSSRYNTLATEGNFNNLIGVPLTLLRLNQEHEVAVVEMGMNHYSELEAESLSAKPDIGVITNIGTAHIEFFGSRENILKAKLEITSGMSDSALLVLNGDDDLLRDLDVPQRKIYFGVDSSSNDVYADNIRFSEGKSTFRLFVRQQEICQVEIPVEGIHNVKDALAAIAVGCECGVSPENAAEALYSFRAPRQKVIVQSGYTIIDDSYNANPESMRAALELLGRRKPRRIAVLGDMLELGSLSYSEHLKLGKIAAENSDAVFLIGTESEATLEGAGGIARHFDSHANLVSSLKRFAEPGDTILFKASHSINMKKAIDLFLEGIN